MVCTNFLRLLAMSALLVSSCQALRHSIARTLSNGGNSEGEVEYENEQADGNPTSATTSTSTTSQVQRMQSTTNVDCSQYQTSFAVPNVFNTTTLNYVATSDQLSAQLVYQGTGWVGVGWSPDGRMIGGMAVIGRPDLNSVAQYALQDEVPSGVTQVPDTDSTLTAGTVVQNDTHTVLTFTTGLQQQSGYPSISVSPDGAQNYFLVAAGASNSFAPHRYRTSISMMLAPCGSASAGAAGGPVAMENPLAANEPWYKAHGFMAAIAWGILAPMAIGNSMCRHLIPGHGIWFQVHRGLNSLVLVLTIAVFAVAFKFVADDDGLHFQGNTHKVVGLVVFILAFIQAAGGLMRPHLPATDEAGKLKHAKSKGRVAWEIVHRLSGFALLGMAWYQCHSGLELYAETFTSKDWTPVFWGITGTISGIVLVGFLSKFFMKTHVQSADDEDGVDDEPAAA